MIKNHLLTHKLLLLFCMLFFAISAMAQNKQRNTKTIDNKTTNAVIANGNIIKASVFDKEINYKTSIRIAYDEKSTSPLGNYVSIYGGKAAEETIAINFYSFKSKESLSVGKYNVTKLDLLRGNKGAVVCPTYANTAGSYIAISGTVNIIYNDGKIIKGNFEFDARKVNDKKVLIKISNGNFEAAFPSK